MAIHGPYYSISGSANMTHFKSPNANDFIHPPTNQPTNQPAHHITSHLITEYHKT